MSIAWWAHAPVDGSHDRISNTTQMGGWSICSTYCNQWWNLDLSLHTINKMGKHSGEVEWWIRTQNIQVTTVDKSGYAHCVLGLEGYSIWRVLPIQETWGHHTIRLLRYLTPSLHHNLIEMAGPVLSKGVVLIHDNATPHKVALVKRLLTNFSWNVFQHPPFSLNLTLSNFTLFVVRRMLWVESGFNRMRRWKRLQSYISPTLTMIHTTRHYDKCLQLRREVVITCCVQIHFFIIFVPFFVFFWRGCKLLF